MKHRTHYTLPLWGLILLGVVSGGVLFSSPLVVKADEDEGGKEENVSVINRLSARFALLQQEVNALRLAFATSVSLKEDVNLPPGIKKKLENGKPLPPGWEKKLAKSDKEKKEEKRKKDRKGNATTTPASSTDKTAPLIFEVPVFVGTSTATVWWYTNEPSWGRIRLSETSPTVGSTTDAVSPLFGTRHKVELQGLAQSATYRYIIVAADKVGNTSESETFTFMTKTPPTQTNDETPPTVFEGLVSVGTSTAIVRWHSSEPTTAEIRYGTTTPITASSTVVSSGNALVSSHQVALQNLTPDTLYTYVVVAIDASGNRVESGTFSFRTNAAPLPPPDDTEPPVIIIAFPRTVGSSTARVVWVTNELSDSRLWLGTSTSAVDVNVAPIASSLALQYFHELEVTGLATSTDYFYTVGSRDSAGNNGMLSGNSFRTTAE